MIEQVAKWNSLMGLDDLPVSNFEVFKIIQEEYVELGETPAYGTSIEELDAFMDIVFATLSGALRLGYDVDGAWAEVVRSNMSKVGGTVVNGKLIKPDTYSPADFAPYLPVE